MNAVFPPPVGPISTVVAPDAASPVSHTGAAGNFTCTRQTLNSGTTIQYTVTRPGGLANVIFSRSRVFAPTVAGFNVTAAFIGDHGLLFKVVDTDSVNVHLSAVFLDLSQPLPLEQNLYARVEFVTNNPDPQFFRNTDGSCLFTRIFLATTAIPDSVELSVFRTDTGALLCNLIPQDRQNTDTFSADILDLSAPAGSDSVRVRHHTSATNIDQVCPLPLATAPSTTRVSVSTANVQGNAASANRPAISGDGRFIAFVSGAGNLVGNDTNATLDIFVRDRMNNTTTRVSVSTNGTQANGSSSDPAISADGRIVAFRSFATNLVANDTNGESDIFVRDLTTNTTTRVSVSNTGAQGINGGNSSPSLSADGRFVAFSSGATNLVTNDTNGFSDIFVRDRLNNTTERVSVRTGGTQATGGFSSFPKISADGNIIAFHSSATNLVASDTNGLLDVFVRNRSAGITSRVSVRTGGTQATGGDSFVGGISGDGRFITFGSSATNLVANDTNGGGDVFVSDQLNGTTTRVSVGTNGAQAVFTGTFGSGDNSISADGRFVVYESTATNLVPNDTNGRTDIFIFDRTTAITSRVSVATAGTQSDATSADPVTSADGRFVAFASDATNLVANDTNAVLDNFVRDRGTLDTGTFDLTPDDAVVVADRPLLLDFTWTVPDPLNWHDLESMQLRIADDAGSIIWIRFSEIDGTFALLNESSGQFGNALPAGTHRRLQTPWASLDLSQTRIIGSGPTGPSVTLELALRFKPQVAGSTFNVDVSARDDQGGEAGFTHAGTLTVTN